MAASIWISLGILSAFICGIFLGTSVFAAKIRGEIRAQIESGVSTGRAVGAVVDMRRQPRTATGGTVIAKVTAPVYDSAGVEAVGEEMLFLGVVLDVSERGMGLLSQHFLPQGAIVKVSCDSPSLRCSLRQVTVRNTCLTTRGLRIGFEFQG